MLLFIGLSMEAGLVNDFLIDNNNQEFNEEVRSSSPYDYEDFSGEADKTKGLDIDFIDEYHGYGTEYYCDQRVVDGPIGNHSKVLIMRDAQSSKNTWSVHYLDTPLFVGRIEFSLWFSSGSGISYHYIQFRDTSDTVAFQLRFELYSHQVYYHSGSAWYLITTLSEEEWYRYSINFNINSQTFDLHIVNETDSKRVRTIFDRPYENSVPIEEIYLATTIEHYHGNTRWDEFKFIKNDYVEILRPDQNIQNHWAQSSEANIDEGIQEPDSGDGLENAQSGWYEYETDIFGFSAISLDRKVVAINIFLLCQCEVYGSGSAQIHVFYRIGETGQWSNYFTISSPFSESWISFRWDNLNYDKEAIDELQIRLSADINSPNSNGIVIVDTMYVEIEYIPQKIGTFYWASDAGTISGNTAYKDEIRAHVDFYKGILLYKGYFKIFSIEDLNHIEFNSTFNEIKEYELSSDTLFFFFWGHGPSENISHSYVKLSTYNNFKLKSYDFLARLNNFDTIRIGYYVDSCKSGYFVEELEDRPYLAISSTDCTHDAHYDTFHEGLFSKYFWLALGMGFNAYGAYYNAILWNLYLEWAGWPLQYALYANYLYYLSGYMFFA